MTDTVRIGDREFRVGATYAMKPGWKPAGEPHTFVHYKPDQPHLEGGLVVTRKPYVVYRSRWAANVWLRWAGDEVTP